MTKYYFTLFSTILLLSCSESNNRPNDFHGNVKEVVETTFAGSLENNIPVKGVKIGSVKYTFEDIGKTIAIESFDSTGALISIKKPKQFNDQNQVNFYEVFDRENQLIETISYEFNVKNQIVLETFKGPSPKKLKNVFKNGKVSESTWLNRDNLQFRNLFYFYNKNGDLAKSIHNLPSGKQVREETFSYQYDDNQNWLIRNFYLDGELKEISQRSISYYDAQN